MANPRQIIFGLSGSALQVSPYFSPYRFHRWYQAFYIFARFRVSPAAAFTLKCT